MSNPFKIGDLVTPTRTCESLCEGCAYIVQDVVVWADRKLLAILSSQGHNILYDATGFKLYQTQGKSMDTELAVNCIKEVLEDKYIKNFLKKLEYVLWNDTTVFDHLTVRAEELVIDADVTTIYGVDDVYTYINNSYDQLTSQAAQKRKLELLDKKAKLDVELTEINKELEKL